MYYKNVYFICIKPGNNQNQYISALPLSTYDDYTLVLPSVLNGQKKGGGNLRKSIYFFLNANWSQNDITRIFKIRLYSPLLILCKYIAIPPSKQI